jgi:hypothetical protein
VATTISFSFSAFTGLESSMKTWSFLLAVACAAALVSRTSAAVPAATTRQPVDPASFSPVITNPLFPLSSLGLKIFEGTDTDPETGETISERLESRVLPDTATVDGVTVLVLEEKAYEDGELVEVALDYFAQHANGDVYYFGERVDNYEDGVLANHDGQWLAGEDAAQAGVIMAAHPRVGTTYEQELAPGIAEDRATALSLTETVSTPAGSFANCLKTRDFTPLEPDVEEFKYHCPQVGLVREEFDGGSIDLVSIESPANPGPAATLPGAPSPAAPPQAITSPDAGAGSRTRRLDSWAIAALAAGLGGLAVGAVLRWRRA